MQIRDRIKELRRVPASQLQPNPLNWRTHPKAQQDALRGILAEVGYADALLARETPEGGLMLIDGHLRAETTPEQMVPVLILDVDEAEAAKLLAVVDPLAAMAETDGAKLDALLREVDTGSAALQSMIDELAQDAAIATANDQDAGEGAGAPLDQRFAVVVYCDDEAGQLAFLEECEAKGIECKAIVM